VVRGAARFQKHGRRRALAEEAGHLGARESAPLSNAAGWREAAISVSDDLHCDVGTIIPLTSREESISSLHRTRPPHIRSGRSLRSLSSCETSSMSGMERTTSTCEGVS